MGNEASAVSSGNSSQKNISKNDLFGPDKAKQQGGKYAPVVSYEGALSNMTPSELRSMQTLFEGLNQKSKKLPEQIDRKTFDKFIATEFGQAGLILPDRLFDVFDYKNTGTIDFKEFISGMFVWGKGTPEQRMKLLFQMFDVEHNNRVSKNEFTRVMKAAVIGGAHQLGAVMYRKHHSRNTKYEDKLLAEQYAMEYASRLDGQMNKYIEALFSQIDADKNGTISWEEWSKFYMKHPELIETFQKFELFPSNDLPEECRQM